MPVFKRDDVELYYEEHGTGFPVLLIAPGGMRSAVSFWERTPWNPIDQLAPHYRVIAMDQRNFTYMFYGLAAAWGILAIYVLTLVSRESRLRKQLDGLQRMIEDKETRK